MLETLLIISCGGSFLIYFIIMAIRPQGETVEARISRLTAKKSVKEPKKKTSLKGFISRFSHLTPQKWTKKLDEELLSSGIPINGGEFIILQIFLFVLLTLTGLLLSSLSALALLLPLLGLFLPRFYIMSAQSKKTQKFNNQLSDVLLVLANSLKAGFSLFQAMEMASQEMPDPIASELKQTLKEMTYGESTESAMLNLTRRIKSKDLELMVTAILIQRQIGGNLAEILFGIHETIQERLNLMGEVRSLTAQGRLSGYIIAFVPFGIGVIVSIIQPEYLAVLFSSKVGISLVISGLFLQLLGFITINKIVKIKV